MCKKCNMDWGGYMKMHDSYCAAQIGYEKRKCRLRIGIMGVFRRWGPGRAHRRLSQISKCAWQCKEMYKECCVSQGWKHLWMTCVGQSMWESMWGRGYFSPSSPHLFSGGRLVAAAGWELEQEITRVLGKLSLNVENEVHMMEAAAWQCSHNFSKFHSLEVIRSSFWTHFKNKLMWDTVPWFKNYCHVMHCFA